MGELTNPYRVAGIDAGSRCKVWDSLYEDHKVGSLVPVAKANAVLVFSNTNDGDTSYKKLVDDVFDEHFSVIWPPPELVSMGDDSSSKNGIPSLIPGGRGYMDQAMNVMLIGPHGTGKTYAVMDLVKEKGWNMAYFSCSTMDPYTDLVGVPVPDNGNLLMVRPHVIDQADFIFFDEFNRADTQVTNAIFEIIQLRTINGEPLPNLKCCWAAMNPVDGDYNVNETDPALLDRFDAYIKMEPRPSVAYYKQFMDDKVAKALVSWWRQHETKQKNQKLTKKRMDYISPRRLEKIGRTWMAFKSGQTIIRALPPNGEYDHAKLIDMLEIASGLKVVNEPDSLKALGFTLEKGYIRSNMDLVGKIIEGSVADQARVIECLFKGSGVSVIRTQDSLFINKYCSASAVEGVINALPPTKRSMLKREFIAFKDDKTVKGTILARVLNI